MEPPAVTLACCDRRTTLTRGTRPARTGIAALLLALTVQAAACGDDDSAGTSTGVPAVSTVPSPAAAITTTTTTIPAAAPTTAATAPPATTTTTAAMETTTTEPPRIWDGLDRLNILLLGSDAGVGRIGTRTDTILLVSIEPETGDAAMISVPRNLTEAPLPAGTGIWDCGCFPDILTHLWANAEWYPEAFPGPQAPPVNALKAAVGLVFGLEVHFYAKVDLAGFVAVIDAIGGVTIDVPKTIVDERYPREDGGREHIVIREGVQRLDGHQALAYARIRAHSGNFARMHRQGCLLGALVDQADVPGTASVPKMVARYRDLAAAVEAHVDTDIPIDRLGDLVELLSRVEMDRVGLLRITRYNYATSGHAGYQLYDLERIRADAARLMEDPTARLDTQDAEGWEATCELSFD